MSDPADRHAVQAWQALQALVQELIERRPDGHLVDGSLEGLDLCLPLALRGPEADPRRFARRLRETLNGLLDDAVQQNAAFRPGHAWCHRCASAACEHSAPPSCRHVFVGYAPTGLPRWQDFAQLCLERKHPRVDELYAEPPALLAFVADRRELEGDVLEVFTSDAHELLGQVMAGFFPLRARAEEGRSVLALTVQLTASRGPGGRRRASVNLLGRAPGGADLGTLWERCEELPWHGAVRWAQATLHGLGPLPPERHHDAALERRLAGIVGGLARRLARGQRARVRKTRHALERHATGQRPTRKALDDVQSAGGHAVLVDERSGTLVVLGERGRTHFFTPEGRLVSSVRYSREAIARKRKLELWRPASPSESEALRAKLDG